MKRNIIWFQVDSLRPDFLRMENYSGPKTFLDELVASGHTFTNCIAAAPYTIAAEVSIFTGLYPHVHGVNGWFQTSPTSMKAGTITFTDILKYAGYKTICIYESAARAYIPPFSFDEYHMLSPGKRWPLECYKQMREPKFLFVQFSGIHDDCIRLRGQYTRAKYRQSLENVSDQVQQVYRQCSADSDIIVVASDHGVRCCDEPEGNHREDVTGQYLTDKTIKVFFSIIDSYSGSGSKVNTSMFRGIDIVPTILDVANLPDMGACGRSAMKYPYGVKYAYAQTGGMRTSPWRPDTWCIRTREWKYIQTKGRMSNSEELYDLCNDPYETVNVLKEYPEITAELSELLQREFFHSFMAPHDHYCKAGLDTARILRARTYPFKVFINVLCKNLMYRLKHRTRIIVKLYIDDLLRIRRSSR